MSDPTLVHPLSSCAQLLADQVKEAFEEQRPLHIVAGGSKGFYGQPVSGEPLSLKAYQGIINYEPSELVITAKAGTPLSDIQSVLAEHGQMLGFEPPAFADQATLGGTIACGLSGPRRPYSGAARDFVLGATIINGKGEVLRFGGQVMKNVAGYDVSRLMCGAQGTLGVLLDISLKVVPAPKFEVTQRLQCNQSEMQNLLSRLGRKPLPISATLLHNEQLYIRLSGAKPGVVSAQALIGGEALEVSQIWCDVKEQQHAFFTQKTNYWRLSLPPAAPAIPAHLVTEQLIEWGGAQRWISSVAEAKDIFAWASSQGGHATQISRGPNGSACFQPLVTPLKQLSQRIKNSFDPAGILNPNRLYNDM